MQFMVRMSNVLKKIPLFSFSSLLQGFFYTCLTQSIMVLQLRKGKVTNSDLQILYNATLLPGESRMPDFAGILQYWSDGGTENRHWMRRWFASSSQDNQEIDSVWCFSTNVINVLFHVMVSFIMIPRGFKKWYTFNFSITAVFNNIQLMNILNNSGLNTAHCGTPSLPLNPFTCCVPNLYSLTFGLHGNQLALGKQHWTIHHCLWELALEI